MSGDPHTEFSLSFARKFFMKIMGIGTLGAWQEHHPYFWRARVGTFINCVEIRDPTIIDLARKRYKRVKGIGERTWHSDSHQWSETPSNQNYNILCNEIKGIF